MNPRKGRLLAWGSVVVGMVVLVICAFAFKERILEQWYLRKLQSGSLEEQKVAVEKLGEMRSVTAVPLFLEMLPAEISEDATLPEALEAAILKVNVEAVPFLLNASRDRAGTFPGYMVLNLLDELEQEEAREAAVTGLIEMLQEEDIETRLWVSHAVLWLFMEGPAVLPSPEQLVGSRKDRIFAVGAIWTLAEMSTAAIPRLKDLARSSRSVDPRERRFAMTVLAAVSLRSGSIGRVMEDLLRDQDLKVRKEAATVLYYHRPYLQLAEGFSEERGPLLAALRGALSDSSVEVRRRAAVALAGQLENGKDLDPALMTGLEEALTHQETGLRCRAAAHLLWLLGPESGATVIASARRFLLEEVRALDAEISEKPREAWTLEELEALEVRDMALEALLPLDEAVVPELVARLEKEDEKERAGAAVLLGRLGAKARSAVPALMKALQDRHWIVRAGAVGALGQIGVETELGRRAIAGLLQDKNEIVREMAGEVLERVGRHAASERPGDPEEDQRP